MRHLSVRRPPSTRLSRCSPAATVVQRSGTVTSNSLVARSAREAWHGTQALAAPVGWFFGEAIDERALPDDLFDMLSNHNNLELLMAVHRITNPAVKRQIIGVIDALETGDSSSQALA